MSEAIVAIKCPVERATAFRAAATGDINCEVNRCNETREVTGVTLSDDGTLSVSWERTDADTALSHLISLAKSDPRGIKPGAVESHGPDFNPEKMLYTATIGQIRASFR